MKNALLIVPLLLVFVSCNNSSLLSQKPEHTPVIDGNMEEWEGIIIIPEKQSFGFGVMNDDTNLYLSMITYDKQIITKILRGLTVWIDPNGKKNKDYGIKYPLQQDMQGMMGIEDSNGGARDTKSKLDNNKMEFFITSILSQQNHIIIIENGLEKYSTNNNGESGIQAKLAYHDGDFTYELKVPFHLLGITTNDKISVGIESAVPERSAIGNRTGGGEMPSVGGRSGGGMRGGRSGGGKGGSMPSSISDMMNPISTWISIQLTE